MRRLLAITLMIAFFAPMAAQSLAAVTADPEAGLPICCRSHGAHHCAMVHWTLQRADSDAPSFATGPCAQYPAAATVPRVASFTVSAVPWFTAEFLSFGAPPAVSARAAHRFIVSALKTRGPPGILG